MKKIIIVILYFVILAAVFAGIITALRKLKTRPGNAAPIPAANLPSASPKPPPAAVLEIFSGNVTVGLPGNEMREAKNNEDIPEGTTVATGEKTRAQLVFPGRSVTRLDDNTEIILTKLSINPFTAEITLKKRRIWNRVAKLLGGESFISRTTTVVAAVRGTSFGHGILPDGRNRIIATKGTVETNCINDSQNAAVTPNKKIILDCTKGGTLPLLRLDEQIKDKDDWFEFNAKEDVSLDNRFGPQTYFDTEATASPTQKP